MAEPWDAGAPASSRVVAQRTPTPIVPSDSIAGRSLTAVVAILTFLAALTAGAVMMVVSSASDWQSDVGREVTIQVRPVSGRDIEADVGAAIAIARGTRRRRRRAGLQQGRIRTARRTVARFRSRAERTADPAHDRGQARFRRDAGFRRPAHDACRAGAERQPRRSPRLDRPDARHGGNRGRRRRSPSWRWSSR